MKLTRSERYRRLRQSLRRQKLLRVPYLQSIHAGRAAVSLGGRLVWRTHLLNSRMRIMALRAARALAGNRQRPATQTTAVVAGGAGPAQPACLFKPPTAAGDPVAEQKREAVWAVWSVVGVVCMILLLLGRILSGPAGPANRLGRLPVPPGAEQNTNESLVTPAVTSPAETVPNDHDPFAAVEMQPQPAFGVEPVAVPERTIPKESPSQPPLVFVEPIRPEPPQLELHLQARPTAAAVARHLSRSGEFDKTFVVEAQTKPVRPEIPSPFANDDRWSSFDVARWQLPTQPVAFRSDDADLSAADMPLASESKASVTATRSFAASTIVRSPQVELTVDSPQQAETGGRIPLNFKVTNTGPVALTQFVLSVELPEQMSHRLGRSLVYRIAELAPGKTLEARLVVTGNAAGTAVIAAKAAGGAVVQQETTSTIEITAGKPPAISPESSLPSPCRRSGWVIVAPGF